MGAYFVGLDLGQRQDFTAVAVVERREAAGAAAEALLVRHLERMPLGTPYTKVVGRVCEMMRHPKLAGRSRLVVDATGVGAPVVELLRAAGLGGRLTAVTITGGERAHGRSEEWYVPRRELLTGLEVLLESKRLKICGRLAETGRLVREFTSLRLSGKSGQKADRRRDGDGCEGPAGDAAGCALGGKSAEHDDLVMALGLACWRAKGGKSGFGTRRLPGI